MEIGSTDSQDLDITLRQRAIEAGMITIRTAPAELEEPSAGPFLSLPRAIGTEALAEVMRLSSVDDPEHNL